MNNETKYNKNTYIGYLKMKKGGMKIIPGEVDNSIISKRNKIINHLKEVFIGGKKLQEKNIKQYFRALGGKYVRSNILELNDEKKSSINNVHKLLKLSAKNNLPLMNVLNTFKGSAPSLYNELELNIKGREFSEGEHSNIYSDYSNKSYGGNSRYSNRESRFDNMMYGGEDIELENLRNDIGRPQFDTELNKLRLEINELRNKS
jgi:hypothetical protein